MVLMKTAISLTGVIPHTGPLTQWPSSSEKHSKFSDLPGQDPSEGPTPLRPSSPATTPLMQQVSFTHKAHTQGSAESPISEAKILAILVQSIVLQAIQDAQWQILTTLSSHPL